MNGTKDSARRPAWWRQRRYWIPAAIVVAAWLALALYVKPPQEQWSPGAAGLHTVAPAGRSGRPGP